MELNHKYIPNKLLFIQLINVIHRSIGSHLPLDFGVNFSPFRGVLLHINENRWRNIHFWIFACEGNEHQWTNVSLTAEVRTPEKIPVEQEQKVYFAKIAGFEQSLGIREAVCNAKNGIKRGFQHLTISGNSGLKMMENMDMDFNIKFEEQDLQL
eukprot:434269_1